MVFDDAGQLTGQTSPNETRSFTYDGAGRRTAWTDASGSTTVAFDDVGRTTEIVTPAGTVGYGYNAAGEIDGILFRITTASDEFRIISVGRLRQNQLVNGISNGRFLPIVGV